MDIDSTEQDVTGNSAHDPPPAKTNEPEPVPADQPPPEIIFVPNARPVREPETAADQPRIDPNVIANLAAYGATDHEILDYLDLPIGFSLEKYARVLAQARAHLRISIRKKQIALANKGNVPMLIFLGKHELGQTDRGASDKIPGFSESWLDTKVE